MELKRSSLLVRWAYTLGSPWGIPDHTTLCAFFWRAFVLVPFGWLLIVTTIGALVAGLGVLTWSSYGIIPGVLFLFWLISRATPKTVQAQRYLENTVFMQGLKSVKSKFCPIITIK